VGYRTRPTDQISLVWAAKQDQPTQSIGPVITAFGRTRNQQISDLGILLGYLLYDSFFKMSHSINVDIYIYMSNHPYEYTHAHPTSINTSERLERLDLEIHEVDQIASHCRWDAAHH
jgi:hypothetical protein